MSSHKLFRVYTCEAPQGSLSVLVTIVPWPAKSLQVTGMRGLHLCEAEIVSSCLEVERQRCGKCRTSEFQELLGSVRAAQGAASRAGGPGSPPGSAAVTWATYSLLASEPFSVIRLRVHWAALWMQLFVSLPPQRTLYVPPLPR